MFYNVYNPIDNKWKYRDYNGFFCEYMEWYVKV
jgi:hypothetical protein